MRQSLAFSLRVLAQWRDSGKVRTEAGEGAVLLVVDTCQTSQVDHATEIHTLLQPEPLHILTDILTNKCYEAAGLCLELG
eukprot:COSAG06_NODE_3570_length_5173_cov_15.270792_3_plen_80_part_00